MIGSLILSITSGLLLSLAFPPWNADLAAWIAITPLLTAMQREKALHRAAICGFFFGFAFFLIDLRWIIETMVSHGKFSTITAILVFISMVSTLAIIPGVFSLLSVFFVNRSFDMFFVAPITWTALEYFRTYVFTGFPWDCLGYSQAYRLKLIQICDLTGVYGLSFLILMGNVSVVSFMKMLSNRSRRYVFHVCVCLSSLVVVLAYGFSRLDHFPRGIEGVETVGIGILQGDVPQDIKWDPASRSRTFIRYKCLAEDALKQGATFMIWPETSVPVVIGGSDITWKYATHISKKLQVPMLIGAPFESRWKGKVNYFNSAFLVQDGELTQRYDKIHLVPFGEYMPLSWILPLGPGLAAREEDYSAGSKVILMRPNGFPPFSVLICYEAIFPDLARAAVNSGAKALVNITNDGWFGNSAAPYQHLAMAGFRAVENRVWLFRAANTGISAVYDPAGRLVASLPLMEQGALVYKVPRYPEAGSFYTHHGDIFAWIIIGFLATMILTNLPILRASFKRRV